MEKMLPSPLIVRILEDAFKVFGFGLPDAHLKIRYGMELTLTIRPCGKFCYAVNRRFCENETLQRAYEALILFMAPGNVGPKMANLTTTLLLNSSTPIELGTHIKEMSLDNIDMTSFLRSTPFSMYANSIKVLYWNIGTQVFSKTDRGHTNEMINTAILFDEKQRGMDKKNLHFVHNDWDFRRYYNHTIQLNLNLAIKQMQRLESLQHCEIFVWGIFADAPLFTSINSLTPENILDLQVLRRLIDRRGGQLLVHIRVSPQYPDFREDVGLRYFRGATWKTTSDFLKNPSSSHQPYRTEHDEKAFVPRPKKRIHPFFRLKKKKEHAEDDSEFEEWA
jgi:hypothetical protein